MFNSTMWLKNNPSDPFNYFNYTIQPAVSKQAFYPSLAVS
jgi:hypothetical protein